MLIRVYLLLMLRLGGCMDKQLLETKTVCSGDNVTLTCVRSGSGSLFWIRLVSGGLPKILGKTYSFKDVNNRISVSHTPGQFVLHIVKAELTDTAVYYCVKTAQGDVMFLSGTDLRVKGPEPHITAAPPSDPVRPEDSVSLQCSGLSDTEMKRRLHSTPEDSENKFNGLLTKECICSFLRNVSTTDAAIFYSAVATCEQTFSRNTSNFSSEVNTRSLQMDNPVLSVLCAALAISVVVMAVLSYLIMTLKNKSKSRHRHDAVVLQTNAVASSYQENQPTDEDSLVYSAPIYISKANKRMRETTTPEKDSIYAAVRTTELD